MSEHDIRWKQRFENFEKAFLFFNPPSPDSYQIVIFFKSK